MSKELFTSLKGIGFQGICVKGSIKPVRDSNTGRFPVQTPPSFVTKKQNKGMPKARFRQCNR